MGCCFLWLKRCSNKHCTFLYIFGFNLRVWRWNRMDIISTIKHFFHEFIPSSTGNLIFGLLVSGISSCLTSLNFWVTILNLRSYCLTLKTMPLFPWALLITAAMLLLTLPVLSGG